MSNKPKEVRQLNFPIETELGVDGTWAGRLPALGVEVEGLATEDAAQQAALVGIMDALRAMPASEGDAWFAAHTTVMPEGYVPECFVDANSAEPLAEVLP